MREGTSAASLPARPDLRRFTERVHGARYLGETTLNGSAPPCRRRKQFVVHTISGTTKREEQR